MKEELQGKLVEILTSIQSAAGKASDFAMEQLPDIAQSYVVYGRAVTTARSLFLIGLAVACFMICRYAFKNPWNISDYSWDQGKKRSDSNHIVIWFAGVFGGFFAMLSFATFDFLVWFAPKVWLLKEIAGMLK